MFFFFLYSLIVFPICDIHSMQSVTVSVRAIPDKPFQSFFESALTLNSANTTKVKLQQFQKK